MRRKNMSAKDLLVAQEYLPIDCVHYVQYIENTYPGIFMPNPRGVYMVGRIDPVLTDGNFYYTKKGLENQQPIEDINTVEEDIYNSQGKIIINRFIMKNKKRFLKNDLNYSYYGIKAINYFINMFIENQSAYIQYRRYYERFLNCFNPSFQRDIMDQTIDVDFILAQLKNVLYDFTKNHEWTIFLTKQIGTICLIEKTVDFRIYDWTLQKEIQAYEQEEQQKEGLGIKVIY